MFEHADATNVDTNDPFCFALRIAASRLTYAGLYTKIISDSFSREYANTQDFTV